MIVIFPPSVAAHLARREHDEGFPVVEQVQQAVDVWSRLVGETERRVSGYAIMRTVKERVSKCDI